MAVVQAPSEYHWYVSEGVPPDACDVRVIDCPLSIVGLAGVIAPTTRAGLTVTRSPGEHCEALGEPCDESVTL